jgi:hypothetical protein
MKPFQQITEEDVKGCIAAEEFPEDVDPRDPDDEVRYINYDNWRDLDDSCIMEDEEFIEHELDYQAHFDPQITNW